MRKYLIGVAIIAIATVLLVLPRYVGVAQAGPPDSATVMFGQDVGSQLGGLPRGHDESDKARDALVPRNVVISQNGEVIFLSGGVHQVAIYAPGTLPKDIDTGILAGGGVGCPSVPLIGDTSGRIAVLDAQPCAGGSATLSFTFNTPGRYLVICTFLPHFVDADMYGWVNVN